MRIEKEEEILRRIEAGGNRKNAPFGFGAARRENSKEGVPYMKIEAGKTFSYEERDRDRTCSSG